MAQIQSNPWLFTNADQATSIAIVSIANQGASALVTANAHGLAQNAKISLQATNPAGYIGGYKIQAVPSVNTFLINLEPKQSGLANAGAAGNVLTAAYLDKVRIEQILWNNPTSATTVLITDSNGFTVWNPTAGGVGTVGPYTYGKVFWVDGLVINALPNGSIQVTVN